MGGACWAAWWDSPGCGLTGVWPHPYAAVPSFSAGVFTAPVSGLYYIRFTGCVGSSGSLNMALMKNGENVFAIYDTRGTHGSGSNGATLSLQQGDRLSVTMWPQKSIFDQSRLSTFSGFLLYPLEA